LSSVTQQLGELRVQANNIEELLDQHIQTNKEWQQHTGERIHAMEQRQLQQQEEWRAYFRWRGYNLDQQK
jgi:ADP-glucose pyrophosphorylase